jgi:hypothetical protein
LMIPGRHSAKATATSLTGLNVNREVKSNP